MPEMRKESSPRDAEAREIIAALRKAHDDGELGAIGLVIRLLTLIDSNPEVLAFVLGMRRGSVDAAWGDNGRSYWAHLYPIIRHAGDPEILVTLERDGGIDDFVGIFESRDAALGALKRRGKYQEL